MKTENKYQVGQRWEHRKQGVVVEIIEVNDKAKTVTLEDEAGNQKPIMFSNLSKTYKLVEEDEKPKKAKAAKATKSSKAKKEEKPAKAAKAAKGKAKKEEAEDADEPETADPKFVEIVDLMKKHNKKDVESLLSVVVIFATSNYDSKYTEAQRSYRVINNQVGLMPKAGDTEPVYMFSLAGDDDPVDYRLYNYEIESAYVEVGDEELPE